MPYLKFGGAMIVNTLIEISPRDNNPRNSEGAFLRGKNGEILFAYSRYHGNGFDDGDACDISLIVSRDEGKTWGEEKLIAKADDFGVKNVMSVSALELRDGALAFYFLIKENDLTSTIGRAVSYDGATFKAERCVCRFPSGYYVINNDRISILSNGKIAAPAAFLPVSDMSYSSKTAHETLLLSDDGITFYKADFSFTTKDPINKDFGHQEPGILERENDIYMFSRTNYGCQYEAALSKDLTPIYEPRPSEFTSPPSPMQIKNVGGTVYAVYNPIPLYNGRKWSWADGAWGRTPIVIRKSTDGGYTFGKLNILDDDENHGYCYPALFPCNDGRMLISYCCGSAEDGYCLCRLCIREIYTETIE